MKTITIEDSVFQALERRAVGFEVTPNDVIKWLLQEEQVQPSIRMAKIDAHCEPETKPVGAVNSAEPPIIELINSGEFLRGDAKQRYFKVLAFLWNNHSSDFEKLDGFRLGSRIQISKSAGAIEQSGNSTHPKQLEPSPFYVCSNLSNPRKRTILSVIMRGFKYPDPIIAAVVKSIPDSSRRRSVLDGLFE